MESTAATPAAAAAPLPHKPSLLPAPKTKGTEPHPLLSRSPRLLPLPEGGWGPQGLPAPLTLLPARPGQAPGLAAGLGRASAHNVCAAHLPASLGRALDGRFRVTRAAPSCAASASARSCSARSAACSLWMRARAALWRASASLHTWQVRDHCLCGSGDPQALACAIS